MNLFNYIEIHVKTRPDSIAIKSNSEYISYKALVSYFNRVSNYLLNIGYKPKDKVILKVHDRKNWIISFLGVLQIGCWVVPVSDELKRDELEDIREKVKSNWLIDDDLIERIILDKSIRDDFNEDIPVLGIYHMTSGSTGDKKFCIRSINALTTEGLSYTLALGLKNNDIILALSPLYHSFALGAALIAALVSGAGIYTINKFVPRSVLKIIHNEPITVVIAVPIMAKLLCLSKTQYDMRQNYLRFVIIGAGPVSEELFDDFKRKFGIHLSANYGSTETGGLLLRTDKEHKTSVGLPMPGVEIKAIGNDGKAYYSNCEGELWVRSKGMLKNYLNSKENVFDKDGFFPTKDIIKIDKNGFFYIIGRTNNIINIGGKKVNPIEIEKVINSIDSVKECVVFGVGKKNKEIIKAIVISTDNNLSKERIRHYCLNKMESYKLPTIIEIRDKLPRDGIGKIIRNELMSK